jgi:adenosylhomocysteine nucleosidase
LLVFVAAERRELEGLLVHVDGVEKLNWPLDFARRGRLNARPVVLVANGPGPKLAGEAVDAVLQNEAVEQTVPMDALVSVGFCGGLRPSLGACDIFVATEVVGVAPALLPTSAESFKTGKLLSMDRVVSTAAEKAALANNADAVEMESAAVADRAKRYHIPFYAVRVVTDTFEESFPLDFNAMRSSEGRFSRAKILAAAFRRPGTMFPELIKLNKRTKRASLALGNFLADARF